VAENITPVCADAVILVPGIMGSELVDLKAQTVLWGLSAKGYASLWTSGSLWEKLKVTDDERSGKTYRVKATRLLTAPAFAPLLRGIEPYSRLIASIRAIAPHRDAVLEYPYDWRLPVAHNAEQLATVAEQHLRNWRAHPCGSRDAKLVLVAHSMGGLIARYFTGVLGGCADVRQTITIGTPFQGAVKTVFLLDRGHGGPLLLPRQRLITLARTLPGVYDLLPSYRCVEEDGTIRRLAPADIGDLGGDMDLARAAVDLHEALAGVEVSDLRTMVGIEQQTMQSLRLRHGVAEPQYYIHENDGRIDWRGDGTVYVQVATGGVEPVSSLPQSHGALARTPEAIAAVRAVLTRRRLGPPMGAAGISLEVPESAVVGEPFEISVTSQGDARRARCRVVDADTDMPIAQPFLVRRSAAMVASARLLRPGLYRIEVKDGGFSAVSQLVLVVTDTQNDRRLK
jgi:hypothetical protein